MKKPIRKTSGSAAQSRRAGKLTMKLIDEIRHLLPFAPQIDGTTKRNLLKVLSAIERQSKAIESLKGEAMTETKKRSQVHGAV
jgi:hypothetical protein